MTLAELAESVGATVEGDEQTVIRGVAPIESAGPDQLSFVANPKYAKHVETTGAGALVLHPDIACSRIPVLRHDNPYLTFARIVAILIPDQPLVGPGIDPAAHVDASASIGDDTRVGAGCVVKAGARVGRGCEFAEDVYIGADTIVGNNCRLYPGVKIMHGCRLGDNVILHSGVVIGSDGFGFAESDKGMVKIKQVGWVEIEDDVEIGANTVVDRGALGPTRVGARTKIDNLVQIAHNVEIGSDCVIVSQVGISGSTKLGRGVVLAGQVGVVGHIELGDGVRVGAQSGVHKSIPPGKSVFGSPARDIGQTARIEASVTRLPDLFKRVRKLEKVQESQEDSGQEDR
ncbi:UDP-3-O-(3-hydroxymyristoyl)glucosamine N-acyltransferase [candidate division GN15 bacterium]|nr:UDP-3-O-(3-hydroxymyristoyl)glucosamine N-acyltransferase [candidate division GN15 bacterium]